MSNEIQKPITVAEMSYTVEELRSQRDYILSEFDYHKVLDFCQHLQQWKPLPFIDYKSVKQIREELTYELNSFISLAEAPAEIREIKSDKWHVGFSYDYDGVTPFLYAEFCYSLTETCAGDMG